MGEGNRRANHLCVTFHQLWQSRIPQAFILLTCFFPPWAYNAASWVRWQQSAFSPFSRVVVSSKGLPHALCCSSFPSNFPFPFVLICLSLYYMSLSFTFIFWFLFSLYIYLSPFLSISLYACIYLEATSLETTTLSLFSLSLSFSLLQVTFLKLPVTNSIREEIMTQRVYQDIMIPLNHVEEVYRGGVQSTNDVKIWRLLSLYSWYDVRNHSRMYKHGGIRAYLPTYIHTYIHTHMPARVVT